VAGDPVAVVVTLDLILNMLFTVAGFAFAAGLVLGVVGANRWRYR
jgi:hypothetical protein